jgi:hypothetical protein
MGGVQDVCMVDSGGCCFRLNDVLSRYGTSIPSPIPWGDPNLAELILKPQMMKQPGLLTLGRAFHFCLKFPVHRSGGSSS